MMPKKEEEPKGLKMKVAEAIQGDVEKGIVRLDTSVMKEIGVAPGDVVEIIGKRTTAAIVDRAYPSDIGLSIIRMDGLTRHNAKSGIGELVIIQKADCKMAKTVTIAPAQKGVIVQVPPDYFKQTLLGRAVVKGDMIKPGGTKRRHSAFSGGGFGEIDNIFKMMEDMGGGFGNLGFGLSDLKFVVSSTNPKGAVLITGETQLTVSSEAVEIEEKNVPGIAYEDIGGLGDELTKVREMVEIPMRHPEVFERLGVEPPKGVLLYGPPGTGKTLLARAVANEADAYFISIAGPEIMSKWVGEAEKKLREIFDTAEKNAPAIIFIDEIDAIAPKREDAVGEVERRVVAQLLATMDGLKSRGRVIVIAATNRPNDIDPALRRPGRFDREIEIGVPDREGRLEILQIHTRNMPLTKDVDLKKLADITHGFVGADMSALAKEAAMNVLRKILPKIELKEGEPLSREVLDKLFVTMDDFKAALKIVRPSSMREVLIEIPKIGWADVGGLNEVKESLKEAVEWPIKYPKSFQRIGIRAPRGVLLMGPPGTGKTMLAKALATDSEANFISVKGPEIFSKWVGESEKAIREIFRRARQASPCIVFFDEIDAIASRRAAGDGSRVNENVIAQLLTEMDGLEDMSDVVVIAATNRPDMIDAALLRPGRFDRVIFIPPPDEKARFEVFKVHTKEMPLAKDVDIKDLTQRTDGYSGADIEAVCREAGISALKEDIEAKEVKGKHFEKAMDTVKPSITQKDIGIYKGFIEQFRKHTIEAPKGMNYLG